MFVFNIPPTAKVIWRRGHSLVSSDRLEKPGIEPATPGLQGKCFICYNMVAPIGMAGTLFLFWHIVFVHFGLAFRHFYSFICAHLLLSFFTHHFKVISGNSNCSTWIELIGVAPIMQYTHVRYTNSNTQGSSPNVAKVIFHTLRNCS